MYVCWFVHICGYVCIYVSNMCICAYMYMYVHIDDYLGVKALDTSRV